MKNAIKKITKNWTYNPQAGSFALARHDKDTDTVLTRKSKIDNYAHFNWFHCREVFSNVFLNKCKSLLYYSTKNVTQNIEDFFEHVENILKINIKDQTQFFATDNEKITFIRVSDFWLCSKMRRQLFTVLLKGPAKKFNKENIIFVNNDENNDKDKNFISSISYQP